MTELNFKGKEFVYNHRLSVSIRPLGMHAYQSIDDPSLDGNLITQGDKLSLHLAPSFLKSFHQS